MESYKKIKFRYYVGELETVNKVSNITDEDGNLAPMHDMSYYDRSVPTEVGIAQRTLGRNLFERAKKIVDYLQALGLDIEHEVIDRRGHANIPFEVVKDELGDKQADIGVDKHGRKCLLGVNEIGDHFIERVYSESVNEKSKK